MREVEKKRQIFQKYIWYAAMLGVGLIFLLFFSTSTSPLLSNTYGSDSAFFQLVGQNMVKGQVIYRDIFDNKGPYLYLIQYLGQTISYGRGGIFLLQLISLSVSLFFVDRTCQMIFGSKAYGIRGLSLGTLLFLLGLTLDGGNLSEEYSLPVLLICLYFFFWYLNNSKKIFPISVIWGLSLGFLVFIRMTNAGFICFLIIGMFVELFLNKKFQSLFKCAIGIILGFIGAALPVCIYCIYKDVFSEMLYAAFAFNYLYGTHSTGRIRYDVISILFMTTPFAVWFNRKEKIYVLFSIVNFIGTVGTLLLGYGYIHYYQLLIPPVLASVWLIVRKLNTIHIRYKNICMATAGLILIFINRNTLMYQSFRVIYAFGMDSCEMENSVLGNFAHLIEDRYVDDWWENYGYRAEKEVSDILDQIPVDAYTSIYNYNTRPYLLRAAGLQPYNKYCQTQESFIAIDPHIKEEIDAMFLQNPPQYVVIENYEEIYNTKMLMRLDAEYYMKYQNKVYTLYERSKR